MADRSILTLNAGSSSMKFAVFGNTDRPRRIWSGAIERIGLSDGRFHMSDAGRTLVLDENGTFADHHVALNRLLAALDQHSGLLDLAAVGHRVAHGGPDCDCPKQITPDIIRTLKDLTPLAPLHLPANIAGIEAVRALRSDLMQVACFDTAFHNHLPRVAQLSGLPRRFQDDGLRRYGFHGLSYEYILAALRQEGVEVERERIVVAHLGNGASMCAIRGGRSTETTMEFSTLAGLPMGTRSGDIDPGLLLYLLTEKAMTPEALAHLLYAESGLLGLSGVSRNMQDLLASNDAAAVEAVAYFCHHARRHLAGLAAAMGGIDRLVFTGGIGANAARVRAGVCEGLGFIGISLDETANAKGARVISSRGAGVAVEARATDEEAMIANHVSAFCAEDAHLEGAF